MNRVPRPGPRVPPYSFTGLGDANFFVVVEKPQHCFALKITDFLQ